MGWALCKNVNCRNRVHHTEGPFCGTSCSKAIPDGQIDRSTKASEKRTPKKRTPKDTR